MAIDTCAYCGNPLPVEHRTLCDRTFEIHHDCQCDAARDARDKAAREFRAERFRYAVQTRLRTAGVPKAYRDVPALPRYRKELLAGRWLYFTGTVGAGKTTSAAIALKDWAISQCREDCDGLFFDFPDIRWMSARETLKTAYDNDLPIDEVVGRAKLVVLDDLGKGKPSEWLTEQIYELVDYLYSEGRTAIITSQYQLSTLAQRLSKGDPDTADAIVSRLRQKCNVYDLGDTDRRQR